METDLSILRYYQPAQAILEADCLHRRRATDASEPAGTDCMGAQEAFDTVRAAKGLALSGGGIRSATFNLGVLQALAQAGILKEIDYLSTVSGGGYTGSLLGRLYHSAAAGSTKNSPAATAVEVETVLASDAAPVLRWLRDNGRYLAPRGLKDRLFAFVIYFRNLVTIHVLLGVTLLAAFLGWATLRICLPALLHSPEDSFPFAYLPDGHGLSPAWIPALLFVGVLFSLSWTYWMHRASRFMAWEQRILALLVATFAILALYQQLPYYLAKIAERLPGGLLLAAFVIGSGAVVASLGVGIGLDSNLPAIRNRISSWMRMVLTALIACALFALLDDAAYRAFLLLGKAETQRNTLIGAGLTGALLAVLRSLAQGFAVQHEETRRTGTGRWVNVMTNILGVALLVLVAFGWAFATEAYVWSSVSRGAVPTDWLPVFCTALLLFLLVLFAGRNLDVLNLSSLHNFYAARLARAYLGPGNRFRNLPLSPVPVRPTEQLVPVSRVEAGDDIAWTDYAPHRLGGPLHLINVNVNQTRYSAAGDFQPDRKGWNLAIGPAGFNLGHIRWQPPGWTGAEAMRLGQWMAISGAAFTTGAGPRTGLGFSALLGLLGVRLGYWWHAGNPTRTNGLPAPHMLKALWQEITGAFNPDRISHWYLSDGGHFENTAAYELMRRGIKRIVLADCGADPRYEFDDLANLSLKVRIDFGVELCFFGKEDLDQIWSGNTDVRDLFTEPESMSNRYGPALMLATIRYPNDPDPGWLIVIKPRLPAQPPSDLAHYAGSEQEFPQQSTLDQFYSEAQWESVHKLGRLLGEQLVRALGALPAWQNMPTSEPADFRGAAWFDRNTAENPRVVEKKPGSPFSLLKIYTPLVIALWTGFEFYSNWQQEQVKEAEETTKFVLARIDVLERQVFGPGGCAASDDPYKACPTVPTQVLIVKDLISNMPATKAKLLSEVAEQIQAAVVNKPQLTGSTTLAMNSQLPQQLTIEQGSPRNELAEAIRARALVYVQIYDEGRRPEAREMIERLQQAGLKPNQVPGIENVVKTAQASGAKPPADFDSLTAIYYHKDDKELAEWVIRQAVPDRNQEVDLLDLSGRFTKVRNGLVELWLP